MYFTFDELVWYQIKRGNHYYLWEEDPGYNYCLVTEYKPSCKCVLLDTTNAKTPDDIKNLVTNAVYELVPVQASPSESEIQLAIEEFNLCTV